MARKYVLIWNDSFQGDGEHSEVNRSILEAVFRARGHSGDAEWVEAAHVPLGRGHGQSHGLPGEFLTISTSVKPLSVNPTPGFGAVFTM